MAELLPQLPDPLVHPGKAVDVSDIVHDKCPYIVNGNGLTLRVPIVDSVEAVVHLLASGVPDGELVQLALIVGLVRGPYVLLKEESIQS